MKKTISLVFLVLLAGALYASMFMFDMDHPVYEEMDALYILEGKTEAMGIRPWTDADVRRLVNAIAPRTETGKAIKRRIESYLAEAGDKDFKFLHEFEITPGVALHTNKDDFDLAEDWYSVNVQDDSLLNLGLGFLYQDYIAAYAEFSLGFTFADADDYSDGNNTPASSDDRYKEYLSTNIPMISEGNISMNFPNRAYFVFGNKALRVAVGRDRLSWGNGMMGNLMLGDTLPYHDYISLTFTGSNNFNYQMLFSFFTHSVDYTKEDDREALEGLKFFYGHRFEWNFLDHSLKFVVNESVMYQSESGHFDVRVLNPLMVLHNFYIAGNSNSLLTMELEWTPFQKWTFYLQLAIDDLAVGEDSAPDDGASADGYAAMLGVKGVFPKKENYLYTGFELVYTSPYMYHRATDRSSAAYDLYYVSSLRMNADGLKIISRYLSLPFGSDALAALFRVGYNHLDKFKVESNLMLMAHGIISKDSTLKWYTGDEAVPTAPSTENDFAEDHYGELSEGEIEYSAIIGGEGEMAVNEWFSIKGALYLNMYLNKDNEDSSLTGDLQLSVGLRFHW